MKIVMTVPKGFARWQVGFKAAPELIAQQGAQMWNLATDLFFDRTQQYVHVVSGNLKASGRKIHADPSPRRLVGGVEYGNENVVYARIEAERGGSHDYITRGWQAAERTYSQVLPGVWQKVRMLAWR